MSFTTRILILIFAILPSLAAAQVSSHSTTVTVGSTQYNLETIYGSFGANTTLLEATPWWGDTSLAHELATEVEQTLGDAGGNLPAVLPSSAFFATAQAFGSVDVTQHNGTSVVTGTSTYSSDYSWVTFVSSSPVSSSSSNNSGLKPAAHTFAPDFIPSNVPTCDGGKFVSGFQIVGNGKITWFIEARKAANCFNVEVTVLPEGLYIHNTQALLAYLDMPELDVYTR